MRRPLLAAVLAALLATQLAYGATGVGEDVANSDAQFVPGQLSVKLSPILRDEAAQAEFAAANGLRELSRAPSLGWIRFDVTDGSSTALKAASLRANPFVVDAIPILLGTWAAFPQDPPNDPRWPDQWGPHQTAMQAAWQIAGGGSSTRPLAIVDSGVDTDHPDLGIIRGANFVGGSSIDDACTSVGGHGTLVAGVAAAFTNNSKGIAGVAYNAPIWSLRIGGPNCASPDIQAATEAIEYAVNIGAYAINASWGFSSSSANVAQLRDAIEYAWSANVPVVAASGNDDHDGFNNLVPAKWFHVVTVGGIDSFGHRCRWQVWNPFDLVWEQHGANYGEPGLDVSAPCQNIVTTAPGGGYSTETGTSFAAPYVSGIVFLMKSEHPSWSSTKIKAELQNTADKIGGYSYSWRTFCGGQSKELGCGRIDADSSVN